MKYTEIIIIIFTMVIIITTLTLPNKIINTYNPLSLEFLCSTTTALLMLLQISSSSLSCLPVQSEEVSDLLLC